MNNIKGKINWGIRFKNKVWLAGFVSQTLLLIQAVILGLESFHVIDWDVEKTKAWVIWITGILDLILAYLSYLGIVIDPTVEGVGDSGRALQREKPLPEHLKNNRNYI